MGFVNRKLSQVFHKLGNTIAIYPKYSIVASVILSITLGTGLLELKFENDIESLYLYRNSDSKIGKELLQTEFPVNGSGKFTPSRRINLGRFAR